LPACMNTALSAINQIKRSWRSMPRNSASGANKQRKFTQREVASGTGGFRPPRAQPGHTDPNTRLDGQRLENSFVHLERPKETVRAVVGTQGWKTPEDIRADSQKEKKSIHDDIWDHFWADTTPGKTTSAAGMATAGTTTTTRETNPSTPLSNNDNNFRPPAPRPMDNTLNPPPRTATPELPRNHPLIPTTQTVLPGKLADIVLKQDQGSGCTVRGVIAEVLTRGDHPWGIKVRLSDGRVGRVQRIHH
jgi:uncharacterized repeat protein (TIGR03833 family)